MKPNILLITADDMNYNSPGVTGCKIDGITPNIDKLATEGMRFVHSHVTVAVCQPSRQVLMTGRYPHRMGAPGFDPIGDDIPTLQEHLKEAGYRNGIIGKLTHLAPERKYCWDFQAQTIDEENGWGRDPQVYYKYTLDFINGCKAGGKPFFLMANAHDPHRPFAGSRDELKEFGRHTSAGRVYSPGEVEVPGFLPDIPLVREEIAQYYTSVRRCDETVGKILEALDASGASRDTLVLFLSDNGMAFPFAKANCYLNSTRSPWIFRWPGVINPGVVDSEHMIAGIDFMPTMLEAAGLRADDGVDGRSFLDLLKGGKDPSRNMVFTLYNYGGPRKEFPMRGIQNKEYGYIFNSWSDQEKRFEVESKSGLSYNAMAEAAERDKDIAGRVAFFDYRVKEEFYDFQKDPDALDNLIGAPEYAHQISGMKKAMLEIMENTGDPLAAGFKALL